MHLKFLISFKIKALNQSQIFEKLRQKGVEVYEAKLFSRFETTFSVKRQDKVIVEEVLANFNAETLSLKPKNFSKIKFFLLTKIGVVVGVVFALALQFISSFFVLQVSVCGTNSKDEIKTYLASQGINTFCPKTLINPSSLELGIIENFPKISMVSVIVKGLTVVVNVKEKESYEELEQNDIVANFNGRIKEIITTSGVQNVNVGDIVKCGDVLVSGKNENAENGVVAKAKIVAEVWYESTNTHIETKTESIRTGNKIEKRKILAFGIEIFSSNQKVDFLDYEIEEGAVKINSILPIEVQYSTYYETQQQTTTQRYDDVRDDIVANLKENTLQNLTKDDIILRENVYETIEAGIITTTYVIVAEKHIF